MRFTINKHTLLLAIVSLCMYGCSSKADVYPDLPNGVYINGEFAYPTRSAFYREISSKSAVVRYIHFFSDSWSEYPDSHEAVPDICLDATYLNGQKYNNSKEGLSLVIIEKIPGIIDESVNRIRFLLDKGKYNNDNPLIKSVDVKYFTVGKDGNGNNTNHTIISIELLNSTLIEIYYNGILQADTRVLDM